MFVTVAVLLCAQAPAEIEQHYQQLDYDRVVAVAPKVLQRAGLKRADAIRVLYLYGTSLVVVGDDLGAQRPFRQLARMEPSFTPPEEMPPRALAVFKLVQSEERELAAQLAAAERARMLSEISLSGGPPSEPEGGAPIPFVYRVRDPRAVVEEVSVRYRRASESSYSALALAHRDDGAWTGEIPADWSSSDDPFQLEFYVETADQAGAPLVGEGGAKAPHSIEVAAGRLDASPFYKTVWFWSLVGAAAVAAGTATYFGVREATALPDTKLGPFDF